MQRGIKEIFEDKYSLLLKELMRAGLIQSEPALAGDAAGRLSDYLSLIEKWNKSVDLVSPQPVENLVESHLIDCAAAFLLLKTFGSFESGVDIGSGAGLPGMVFAILDPACTMHLVEPREKRAIFLAEARRVLGLKNVVVHRRRMEELAVEGLTQAGFVISRALGDGAAYLQAVSRLVRDNGLIFMMVGPSWNRKRQEHLGLPQGVQLNKFIEYNLSAGGPERGLAVYGVSRETPSPA